jgi:hypothetical protein
MNHAQAVSMVHGKRNATRRKVGNNTYAEILHDGSVGIMLHSTYVVTIHADDTYTLRTGGWYTPTTKDRMNQYSAARVYQEKGEWYVRSNGRVFPYIEGMTIQ